MNQEIPILAQRLVQLLKGKGEKISTVESCTGGLVSAAVTDVSGSSDVFDLGVVTYANSAKAKVIGVSEETLERYGAVSEETAVEMAIGISRLAGAKLSLSVTGIAGPSGGTADKPVGTVYICCKCGNKLSAIHLIIDGDRQQVRHETVRQSLILAISCATRHID